MAAGAVPGTVAGTGVQPTLDTGTGSETESEAGIGFEADTVTQLKTGVETEIGTEIQATWLCPDWDAAADDD